MPFTEGAPALDFACTAIFSTAVSPIAYLCNRTHHLSEILRMSANEFAVAIDQRYFEDYVPGGITSTGLSSSPKPRSSTSPKNSTRNTFTPIRKKPRKVSSAD